MRKFLLLLVLCLGSVGATFAQIKISGKVVDAETGQPLIGATVMIGTTTGVATLADGTYVLPVPASAGEHPVLTFTYIGYESLNVTVGKNHVVNAKLKPEVALSDFFTHALDVAFFTTTFSDVVLSSTPESDTLFENVAEALSFMFSIS